MDDFPNVKPSGAASAALRKPVSFSTDAGAEQGVLLAGGLLKAATREMRVLAATRGRSWRTARRIARVTAAAALALSLLGVRAPALTPEFDGPFLNPFGLATVRSRSNPEFVDIDGDGDFDALIGTGYDGDGWAFFENTGTETAPKFSAPVVGHPFGLHASGCFRISCGIDPAFADIDGDGDLDVLVGLSGSYAPAYGFFQTNEGTVTAPAFAAPVYDFLDPGQQATLYWPQPALVDIDGDGDLDGLFGNFWGDVVFFENTGSATEPAFAEPSTNPFGLANVGAIRPAFADIDGDGDLDGFFGNYSGDVVFFENTGSATEPAFAEPSTNPFGLANVSEGNASPTFADIDGDGDLDALIGNGSGDVVFFENLTISEGMACVGDCDRNGEVRINELTLGVAIALGNTDADQCRAIDQNRDQRVAVHELVAAVRAAVEGCPAARDP